MRVWVDRQAGLIGYVLLSCLFTGVLVTNLRAFQGRFVEGHLQELPASGIVIHYEYAYESLKCLAHHSLLV